LIWKYFGSRMVVLAPDTGSVTTVSSSMSTSAWLATWAAIADDVSPAYAIRAMSGYGVHFNVTAEAQPQALTLARKRKADDCRHTSVSSIWLVCR
jgi:hypothetical protein